MDDQASKHNPADDGPFSTDYLRHLLIRAASDPVLNWFDNPSEAGTPQDVVDAVYQILVPAGQGLVTGKDIDFDFMKFKWPITLVGIKALTQHCHALTDSLTNIEDQIDDAIDASQFLVDEIACSVFEKAFDIWAVFTVLGERIDAQCSKVGGHTELLNTLKAFDACLEAIEKLDRQMQAHTEALTCALDTNLIPNLRNSVSDNWKPFLPWYFNGGLERVAAQMRETFLRSSTPASMLDTIKASGQRNRNRALLGDFRPMLAAAADAGNKAVEPPITHYWHGPDGLFAEMSVAANLPDQADLVLCFYDLNDNPARALSGHKARLAGVIKPIDAQGLATFTRQELRQGNGSPLELLIDEMAWAYSPYPPEGTNRNSAGDGQ